MSHGPHRFRESEARRLIKAARDAGITIGRVEVGPGGRIAIIPGKTEGGNVGASNPWDEVLTNAADEERTA
jgi:hypothetical protein